MDRRTNLFLHQPLCFNQQKFHGWFVQAPHVGVVLEAFFLGQAEGTALTINVRTDAPDPWTGKRRPLVRPAEELTVINVIAILGG